MPNLNSKDRLRRINRKMPILRKTLKENINKNSRQSLRKVNATARKIISNSFHKPNRHSPSST